MLFMVGRFISSTTTPEADRRGRGDARATSLGKAWAFENVSFQFEPIAAALDYERQIAKEEIALIADIGGGTSDISIVRLSPERHRKTDRHDDILGNDGGGSAERTLTSGSVSGWSCRCLVLGVQ